MRDDPARIKDASALVADGWRRVAHAPWVLAGVWLVTLLVTVPLAVQMSHTVEGDLGNSMTADRVAAGVDWGWWGEFAYRHPDAKSFGPFVIGFAAVVRNVNDFIDTGVPPAPVSTAAALYIGAWLFLLGGILDRYARRRRVGAHGFFAACGVFFWRLLRLAIVAALAYGAVFWLRTWLLGPIFAWMTRDVSVERTAFLVRLLLYVPVVLLLAVLMVWFDLAKARAVVEDRRSMLGALAAAFRVMRRYPAACAGMFALNLAIFGGVVLAYAVLAPGAAGGGAGALALTLLVGQAYIVARLAVKLAVYATAVALVQNRVAHLGYTAAPEIVWPDSPAAEAISKVR